MYWRGGVATTTSLKKESAVGHPHFLFLFKRLTTVNPITGVKCEDFLN